MKSIAGKTTLVLFVVLLLTVMGTIVLFKHTMWTIVAEQASASVTPDLLEIMQSLESKVTVGLFALVVIGTATAFIVTTRNTAPLHRLIEQAHRLTQGSFERHFEVEGPQEVNDLAEVFEQIRLRFRQVVSGAITKAMIWEGQLELFPMSQLLMMLRFTAQTGVLVIMDGNNLGRIYIKNGQVRGASFKDQRGFTAFYALFLLPKGSFKFNTKMKPFEDELLAASWYSVLLYAARRVTSLQLIEQYIPDQQFVATKIDLMEEVRLIESDLTLPEWELYDAIDGKSSVRELARRLQWTPERVQRYLYRFAVVGLIETQLTLVEEPPPDNVVSLWARAAWNKRTGGI
ncbi:MAG: DUF4388 domain-containing protein [Firmicutes bacterium]|nr:DUF4388 domain-containing protein [Bacillota bacterium]